MTDSLLRCENLLVYPATILYIGVSSPLKFLVNICGASK